MSAKVWFAVIWTLWIACNDPVFNNKSASAGKLLQLIKIDKEDGSTTALYHRELDIPTLLGLTKEDYITLISLCNTLPLLQASTSGAYNDEFLEHVVTNHQWEIDLDGQHNGRILPIFHGFEQRAR
ncbi:hypothetical protein Ancab_014419 [Ancistrocladus abbreviatus]